MTQTGVRWFSGFHSFQLCSFLCVMSQTLCLDCYMSWRMPVCGLPYDSPDTETEISRRPKIVALCVLSKHKHSMWDPYSSYCFLFTQLTLWPRRWSPYDVPKRRHCYTGLQRIVFLFVYWKINIGLEHKRPMMFTVFGREHKTLSFRNWKSRNSSSEHGRIVTTRIHFLASFIFLIL
jgi:hypothetical protein